MTCQVCGVPEADSHFGGVSCRACAAFFRRYCHSKKPVGSCSCKIRFQNSHPCRECRVKKCLAVGMTADKVQSKREKHSERSHCLRKASTSSTSPVSLIYLPSKDTFNITSTLPIFSFYEQQRSQMFSTLGTQSVTEVTSLAKADIHYAQDFLIGSFPGSKGVKIEDRKSLITGFVMKLWQVEPILDHVANRHKYQRLKESEIKNVLFSFLAGCFIDGAEMPEEDIWRTFGSIWTYFYRKVIDPIVLLDLDQIELMAVIWIICFDYAYNDLSTKSVDFCWNIRKVMHRELHNYLMEKFEGDSESAEIRFLEVLEVPIIVERGEQKFQEEVLLFEMNRVRMSEDFVKIMKKRRI